MQDIVQKKFDEQIQYRSYGSKGQSQFGIDLVPSKHSFSVVGQCKLAETSFTWKMVLEELKKTDSYPNSIHQYILLTTANPHTTVQDVEHRGPYYHQRKDGTKFQVHVRYWERMDSLDFVPRKILKDIFPEAFSLAERPASTGPSSIEVLNAIPKFKEYIQRSITTTDLEWLETWNFSHGYLLQKNYDPFQNLYIEHDRAVTALNGIPSWLYVRGCSELATALPAGERFFNALSCFRNAIYSHTIGDSLPNGERTLSLKDLPDQFVAKMTINWKSTAAHLAQVYREDVLGEVRG